MNGITYFKLLNPKYGGDTTKGCALTGAEVDGNFNFLRGYDIESIGLVNNNTTFRLKRVNGENMDVDLQNDTIRREVDELSANTASISGKVETDTEKIRTLEDKVRRLEEANERLEGIVNELSVLVNSLQLDEAEGSDFGQKVRYVVGRFVRGNPSSVDFDLSPNSLEPTDMYLRFGDDAHFVANMPGSQNQG